MPNIRQKRVAKILAEGGTSVSGAMIQAGYSPASAKNPKQMTKQQGFKEAMSEYGLTENLIATSLVEDIKANVGDRVEELKLGAKILRMTVEDVGPNTAIQINIGADREKYA